MYLILKRWLTGFAWPYQKIADNRSNSSTNNTLDHNDLAFKLATADSLQSVLPKTLLTFETQINSGVEEQNTLSLLVLLSSTDTCESSLYHSENLDIPENIIQSLHKQFTISKTQISPQNSLFFNQINKTLLPVHLFNHEQQHVWLLYLFNPAHISLEQLRWKTPSFENTLIKGLEAWCQTESKVKAALHSERATYAAELHDSIAQILGYLKIKSTTLDKLCEQPPYHELKSITEDIATYTHCAYHQTRELIISSRLVPQSDNLSHAVSSSITDFEHQSAIVFELDNRIQSLHLTSKESMQILYIIRESLSNIIRHSHASHSYVRLYMKSNNVLQVEIEDNGIGISASAARRDSFGLQIMHERAERIGAKLDIAEATGDGTLVKLVMKLGDRT